MLPYDDAAADEDNSSKWCAMGNGVLWMVADDGL